MTLFTLRSRLLACLALTAAMFAAAPRAQAQQARYVPGELLVGVAEERTLTPMQVVGMIPQLEQGIGVVISHHDALHAYHLHLNPGVSMADAIARLKHRPGVLYAEPNYIRHTCAVQPNDPLYVPYQYGPQIVKAPNAWSIWKPKRQVVIAMVDTGILNTHEDLTNKILRDNNGIVGFNAFSGLRDDALDDQGHGTHTAGIAAAQSNNGKGVAGIAGWDGSAGSDTTFVKLMPVKVLDSNGSGTDGTVASGITWAADHGANVISMSLGDTQYSSTLDTAVQYAYAKGCVIVAAAGNNGDYTPFYPAANANVISVAATDNTDTLASFSTAGPWVMVAAPGVNIMSSVRDGTYNYSTGTSMSCPHVAGEAALLLSQNATLTNDQATYLIRNNYDPYNGNGRTIFPNSGRINVGAALANIGSVPAPNPGTASFVKVDTQTQGNWKGVYGSQGRDIFFDSLSLPAGIKESATGELPWIWDSNSGSQAALQTGSGSGRIAGCSYDYGVEIRDINITDGQTHQVSLYCLDYDNLQRAETIDVLDADTNTVLDTRSLSGYQNGAYVCWNIKGHVKFRLTNTGAGPNAVFSGIFFDAQNTGGGGSTVASATFVKSDTTSQGTWKGKYGADGYNIINYAASYPGYATVSASGNATWTWDSSTSNLPALQKPDSATDRFCACWYSGTNFIVDVNLTDGNTHQVTLYSTDYDAYNHWNRAQTIDVLDATTNAVLSTQSMSNMQNGVYMVWNIKGHVRFRLTNTVAGQGPNAVLSGLFFDAAGGARTPPAATFVKADTGTSGSWKGAYGSAGYNIVNLVASFPSYASLAVSNQSTWTWDSSTANLPALQKPDSATDRFCACWYSGTNFIVDVNLTDGNAHQVSLYCVDYDAYNNWHRAQTIAVLDADTGAVLDTRNVSNMQNGVYMVWNIKGHVKFRLTNLVSGSGPNAVLSGVFFD